MNKSFYHYVLMYRGGEWADQKSRFSEAMFEDLAFPKSSASFDELSRYVEMQASEFLTAAAFDELWSLYVEKYSL